jgi:D-ala D-ala ligase N-terminal domain protein
MGKKRLGVIFGGTSTEHEVSIVSGTSVIKNLNKEKYEIYPIYIDKAGEWYEFELDNKTYKVGDEIVGTKKIENIWNYLKTMDILFPVLHGLQGEDGTIQGMFELLKIPYVGTRVLGSSVCMDKVYSKIIFEKAKLNQAKYVYIRKFEDQYIYINEDFSEEVLDIQETVNKIMEKIDFPMFVKPSNSGSSVGISKAKNKDELINSIIEASKFDKKILIEENINGREIECAVLGNEEVKASVLGEILPAEAFYSFSAKYQNSDSKTVEAPDLPEELTKKVRELAVKAYKAADCQGLSRVDFFVDDKENKIYINEINTLPGFTEISMYPKLWEKSGLTYTELLDKLIELAY